MPSGEPDLSSVADRVPAVSIALCTYNGAEFLAAQLDSLLAQSFTDFEIVAVDDGSSDATVAILQAYAQRDARLRVFANQRNLGFKLNFEVALQKCRGPLIAPCDQDDVWQPRKLAQLVPLTATHVMAYCDSALMDAGGKDLGLRMSQARRMLTTAEPLAFLFANCISGHAMLFRREVLASGLPVPDGFFHDWWLAFVASTLGSIAYVDQPLVNYRRHGAAITNLVGAARPEGEAIVKGHKARELKSTENRLATMARLPGAQQPLLMRWLELWRQRQSQFLSPALVWFVLRHRHRIFAIERSSEREKIRLALRLLRGQRLLRLLRPFKYAE